MSAQPVPYVENRADHERSMQWARERSNAGDDTLEICPHCMCEIDVDPQPHRPGCPGIGAPRVSTDAVLAGDRVTVALVEVPVALVEVPPAWADGVIDDGLDALERMDAGLPQEPHVDDAPDVDELLEPPPVAPRRGRSGARAVWTRDAIVAAIVRWNGEHGEPPRSSQWTKKVDGYPTCSTVLSRFGSWGAAIKEAGFEPRQRGGQKQPPNTSQTASVAAVVAATRQAVVASDENEIAEPGRPAESRDQQLVSAAIDASGEERLAWIDRLHREAHRSKIRAAALDQIAEGLRVLHDLHQEAAA